MACGLQPPINSGYSLSFPIKNFQVNIFENVNAFKERNPLGLY